MLGLLAQCCSRGLGLVQESQRDALKSHEYESVAWGRSGGSTANLSLAMVTSVTNSVWVRRQGREQAGDKGWQEGQPW